MESEVIGGIRLKLDALKQIIWDYRDRLKTPVYIGVRKGYLSKTSENELNLWASSKNKWEESLGQNAKSDPKPEIELCSPIDAVEKLLKALEKKQNG